jgi:glycerol-1-phosphate dehydrogenase [NAD(P)+]
MTSDQAGEMLSVWRRQMELPRYLSVTHGQAELAGKLTAIAKESGFARVCLISGATFTRSVSAGLAERLAVATGALAVSDNSQDQVEALVESADLRDVDAVIAIGGGKTIDVAKSVCEQADLPVIVVPTQLTADGIASPVSVIRTRSGAIESRHARLPIGLVVDLEVLVRSPVESARAGLGDLIANACAVRDWRRAAAAGQETTDDFAALLAEAGSDLVCGTDVTSLREGPLETGFLHRLLQGLVLSGLAMEIAGSSRPCSGSEHLVSHAIDQLYRGTARHGEQVAFGTLLCSRFQGEDWQTVRRLMASAGMERAAAGFGLSDEQIVEAVRAAPATRPNRYTVLDEIELTDTELLPMIREVLTPREL